MLSLSWHFSPFPILSLSLPPSYYKPRMRRQNGLVSNWIRLLWFPSLIAKGAQHYLTSSRSQSKQHCFHWNPRSVVGGTTMRCLCIQFLPSSPPPTLDRPAKLSLLDMLCGPQRDHIAWDLFSSAGLWSEIIVLLNSLSTYYCFIQILGLMPLTWLHLKADEGKWWWFGGGIYGGKKPPFPQQLKRLGAQWPRRKLKLQTAF